MIGRGKRSVTAMIGSVVSGNPAGSLGKIRIRGLSPGCLEFHHPSERKIMNLSGKVALVTGGGTGIGAACARRFAREGARVAVMGRRPELIGQVAAEIGGLAVCGDAANADDVRSALDAIVKSYGGLDILVASAGTGGIGAGALETDDASWAHTIRGSLCLCSSSGKGLSSSCPRSQGSAQGPTCAPTSPRSTR